MKKVLILTAAMSLIIGNYSARSESPDFVNVYFRISGPNPALDVNTFELVEYCGTSYSDLNAIVRPFPSVYNALPPAPFEVTVR